MWAPPELVGCFDTKNYESWVVYRQDEHNWLKLNSKLRQVGAYFHFFWYVFTLLSIKLRSTSSFLKNHQELFFHLKLYRTLHIMHRPEPGLGKCDIVLLQSRILWQKLKYDKEIQLVFIISKYHVETLSVLKCIHLKIYCSQKKINKNLSSIKILTT